MSKINILHKLGFKIKLYSSFLEDSSKKFLAERGIDYFCFFKKDMMSSSFLLRYYKYYIVKKKISKKLLKE